MKKCLIALLCAATLLSLTACGETKPADGASKGAYTDGFFLTEEYERLYYAPFDGSETVLLTDRYTRDHARSAGSLLAEYEGGSVERIDPADGSRTTLREGGEEGFYNLALCGDGFIGQGYTPDGTSTVLCFRNGESERFEYDNYINELCTLGGEVIFFTEWSEDETNRITAYDFAAKKTLWQTEFDCSVTLKEFDLTLYATKDDGGAIWTIDPQSGERTELELPLEESDYSLLNVWNGVYLVEGDYSDDFNYYLVKDGERKQVTLDGESIGSFYVSDAAGQKVLLGKYNYDWDDYDENGRSWVDYYMLDMESGEVTPFTVRGQYAKLFENGDFPLMDSSTARKPVTEAIYSLLCANHGYSGCRPLCSTTHGAWLNIADRAADIALLAAPTEEEQAYLKERGVEVEMKLYGGDGLVFIGGSASGVTDLTLDQVRAIYRGEITNWSQLGGADHKIDVLYRDDQSGSQRLFEKLLWKDEPVPDFAALGFDYLDEMSTIVWQVEDDPYAIGYSIMTYLSDVYANDDLLAFTLEGVAATPENVKSNAYPLSTQGYAVIRADEPEDSPARRLYNWIGCGVCDDLLENNGVTPLRG
ncbi:MAG: substrate-binding domain-containing protein [Oscillibacter sp.]|nr:substrate-binding domain-containing protein [Oscillibacter sp.]